MFPIENLEGLLAHLDDQFWDQMCPREKNFDSNKSCCAMEKKQPGPEFPAPNLTETRFQLSLPVPSGLDPNKDLSVKLDSEKRHLSVIGHREWKSKEEEVGDRFQSIHYEHRCSVPDSMIEDKLTCKVSPDGLLITIEAPLKPKVKPEEENKPKAVEIPVQIVGKPSCSKQIEMD